jgi:hypothetical protein
MAQNRTGSTRSVRRVTLTEDPGGVYTVRFGGNKFTGVRAFSIEYGTERVESTDGTLAYIYSGRDTFRFSTQDADVVLHNYTIVSKFKGVKHD